MPRHVRPLTKVKGQRSKSQGHLTYQQLEVGKGRLSTELEPDGNYHRRYTKCTTNFLGQ